MPGITVPSTVPCSHPCSCTVSGLFPGLHVRSIEYAYIHTMFPDMLGAYIAGICMLRRIFMALFNMRAEKGSGVLGIRQTYSRCLLFKAFTPPETASRAV